MESRNSHILHFCRSLPLAFRFCKGVGKKPQISLHNSRHSTFYELLVSKCIMDWYVVTLFHGQIIPSHMISLNSQIVPQYCQNFSGVLSHGQKQEHCSCVYLVLYATKAYFTSSFTLTLWNNQTI